MYSPPRFLLYINRALSTLIVAATAVCYIPLREGLLPPAVLWALIPLFCLTHILPYLLYYRVPGSAERTRLLAPVHSRHSLRACAHGVEMLKIFLLSTAVAVVYHLVRLPLLRQGRWADWLISAGIGIVAEAIVFWNGMLCLYVYSVQLGIRWRVIGALCGLIPIAQLIALSRIMKVVSAEVETECARIKLNEGRREEAVCATKYPLLLVHGVFFRDSERLNYWGRIPHELTVNGATVYYGHQHSAASVADCARELADRIREITRETGCEKVNVIAHSKGGLDMRCALEHEGIADCVASLTTVNTPHRGCLFADFLLHTLPETVREKVASTYNKAARKLGDKDPDFLAAVRDLTASRCAELNAENCPDPPEGMYCQSIGSRLDHAAGGRFPLNFSYYLVRFFDGPNDGLVSEASFPWGENFTLLTAGGKRGISHGDMIDLNREDIEGFDVREFYVKLVADLKNRGL